MNPQQLSAAARDRQVIKIPGTNPRLTLHERPGRHYELYIKCWLPGGRRIHRKLSGLDTFRDEAGEIDSDLKREAEALARSQQQAALEELGLLSGEADREDAEEEIRGPWTLSQGFRRVLSVLRGKYVAEDVAQRNKVERAGERVMEILGPHTFWEDLKPNDYLRVGRVFAERYKEGTSTLGHRMAEETIQLLLASANWLKNEGLITKAVQPPQKWRKKLRKEWKTITKTKKIKVHRPRYTREERTKLWAHLPEADCRVQLAMELGAGDYRGGQLVDSNRSDLDLSPGAGIGYGTFEVHGCEIKPGAIQYLTKEQRAAVDRAIGPRGHLHTLEQAYQRGEIPDYPIFAGGKLLDGKCQIRPYRTKPPLLRMNRRTLLGYLYDLEEIAGVEHVEGRGFYGLRRIHADLTSQHTEDREVRCVAGGWSPRTHTRGKVYRDPDDPFVLRKAAHVREKVRGRVDTADELSPSDVRSWLLENGVPEPQVELMLAAVG